MAQAEETGKRHLTADDIYNILLVNDAQISPDAQQVAYVETRVDREKNDYRSSLYLVPAASGQPRRFTTADAQDSYPRWSPTGDRLAFLSNRAGKKQLWVIPAAGGEASQLTDLPQPVNAFTWSPDGTTIAFVSKADSADLEKKDGDEKDKEESDAVRITRLRFRSDGVPGFLDNRPAHIWCVAAEGGAPWQVTSAEQSDGQPAWSPDGQGIAFVSNRTEEWQANNASEIWVTPVRGGEARCVIGGPNASFRQPAWSPDGSQLAIVGHQQAGEGGSRNANVWVVAAGGGEPRSLTAGLDRPTTASVSVDTASGAEEGIVWNEQGIYFPVTDQGSVHIYCVTPGNEPKLVVGGKRRVLSYSLSADGSRLAFAASTPIDPCEVYICDANGAQEERLTDVNGDFMRSVAVSEPQEFHVPSYAEDKRPIHGWLMKPIGFQEGQKYPLILEIHGGPHSSYANAYFHEFQLLAAQGYAVVYTNPRGSQGYGEEFAGCTRGTWGESDMPDVMAAVDYAIAQGFVDESRLGVTGGSYGGFMTNWVVSHSDRFKAAVTQRCVSNMLSFFGTSDIGTGFGIFETNAIPWENPEQFLKMSPLTYAHEITTPLLIIHSEQDYRCPIEQGEQLYVRLKKLGREVEFLRFPGESHGLSRGGKPKHRVERLNAITGWFEGHL
ncbi:MAG TPA: S9 family peptidase [Thermomicrobiaceae bacterium]|nr:S9 family peptidase [Thermomicrobiaceae bacterium]